MVSSGGVFVAGDSPKVAPPREVARTCKVF